MTIKPRKAIEAMRKYDPPLEKREGKLRLDFNENTFGCSPKVIAALKEVKAEEIATYPEYGKFIKKLATYLNLNKEELLLTNGTDEAIRVVMETFLENKSDEIILPTPTFAMFKVSASLIEAKVILVLYNKDLSFPTKRILNRITDETKLIILVNPNNPTGTSIKEEDIIKIVEKAKNSLVLIDEAYYQYYGQSAKGLIKDYDNIIVLQTFSKAFGLAGLRLGYAISNKEIITSLKKVISPYSVNVLALIAASAALEDLDFVDNYVKEIKESRIFLEKELKKLGIKTFPSEANFLLVNFGDSCNEVYQKLKEKGILVRDRSSYPLLKDCLRITLGTTEQTKKLVKEIKNILRKKILLFDLDGVLVDVSKSYRLAIKKTAEYFTKQKVGFDEIQELKEKCNYNNDWDLTEDIILRRKVKVSRDKIIQKFQKFYLENRNREKWLLNKKILQKLYRKYKLAIVTGRPKEEAFFTLRKNNVEDYFDVVITMDDVPQDRQKPDPYGIRLALDKLKGNNAIYFGDCVDDVKAAKSAKIEAIGVLSSVPSKNLESSLKKEGAKLVIGDVNKILKVLEK